MATKYFMAGGSNNNWYDNSNWSLTSSSGPNDTTYAVAGDDVILDSGSPNCIANNAACAATSINTTGYTNTLSTSAALTISGTITLVGGNMTVGSASSCGALNCTNFTGTLTCNAAFTVHGAITLGSGMSSAGTSVLIGDTSANWTSNGHNFNCRLSARGSNQTYTLVDNWTILKAFDGQGTPTLNQNTLSCVGLTNTSSGPKGSTNIVLTGGTWSGNNGVENNLSFAGNVTVSGAVTYGVGAGTGTISYTSGTVTTTGSTLTLNSGASAVTMNTNGITWNEVVVAGNTTVTLNSLLDAATLTINAAASVVFTGTAGFDVGSLYGAIVTSAVKTITLKYDAAVSYIASGVTLSGTDNTTNYREIKSSSGTAGQRATLVVTEGTALTFVRITRINGTGSGTCTTTGTITDSVNWFPPSQGGSITFTQVLS